MNNTGWSRAPRETIRPDTVTDEAAGILRTPNQLLAIHHGQAALTV